MELLFYIIIGLLVILIIMVVVSIAFTVRLETIVTQTRDTAAKKNGDKSSNDEIIKQTSTSVAAMLREFLPADGASISFRVNEGLKYIHEALVLLQGLKQSTEEARNAVRTAQEGTARIENQIGNFVVKLDAVAIAQAKTADTQARMINLIQSNAPAEQIAAGEHIDQSIRAGDEVIIDKVKR